jgi:lipopolysaccharide/colanic/teichoic acid biosynthesis glycosyltransferase
MTGDGHGTQGDLPTSGLARPPQGRSEAALVGPVTVGRPRWRRRYARANGAVHAAAIGSSPGLYLLWDHVVGAPPLVMVVLSVVLLSFAGQCALDGWLTHLRRGGRAMSTMLAVGDVEGVAALVERTRRAPGLGWRVIGACTPTGTGPNGAASVNGVPVLGDLDGVAALALAGHADAVAVRPAPGWTAVRVQHLARDLDYSRTALLVDRRLMHRAGPRVRVRAVNGLPLLRVDHPGLGPAARFVKGTMDRLGALLALVLLAPVLLVGAVAVRRDGGPAFRRHARIGRGGREFSLLTFRTTGADGTDTGIGRLLHRHCLDELPQLFNVISGSMALVGPRPSAPEEIGNRMARGRLLVKPGLTGLDDVGTGGPATEPDLHYITRWTPVLDVRILVRSLGTGLRDRSPH